MSTKLKTIETKAKTELFCTNLYNIRSSESFAMLVMCNKPLRELKNSQGTTLAHVAVLAHEKCAVYALTEYSIASLSDSKGYTVAHMTMTWPNVMSNFEKLCLDSRILLLRTPYGVSIFQALETKKRGELNAFQYFPYRT